MDVNSKDYFKKDDNLKRYLKEISKIRLLTAEEEKDLAIRMRNGDKEARAKLIESNVRLVVFIAKKYQNPFNDSFNDLIQAGNWWLAKNVERFDPSKGRFSTFATEGIKGSIKNFLSENKKIKISKRSKEEINKIKVAEKELREKLGRNPEAHELAKYMKTSEERIIEFNILNKYQAESFKEEHGAIEAPTNKELEEESDEILINKDKAKEFLNSFTQREREYIELTFGLHDDEFKTQAEISRELGVSRARIHKVQKNTIKKLNKQLEDKKKDKNTAS